MNQIIQSFFNLAILKAAFGFLMKGFGMTILLCLTVIPLGLAGGLTVALLSTVKNRVIRWLVIVYTDFFRAFPPLVLLIFIYFGVPFIGIDLPPFIAVALGFLLNNSSYYGEVFRAGIESIPKGQAEAARSIFALWRSQYVASRP